MCDHRYCQLRFLWLQQHFPVTAITGIVINYAHVHTLYHTFACEHTRIIWVVCMDRNCFVWTSTKQLWSGLIATTNSPRSFGIIFLEEKHLPAQLHMETFFFFKKSWISQFVKWFGIWHVYGVCLCNVPSQGEKSETFHYAYESSWNPSLLISR